MYSVFHVKKNAIRAAFCGLCHDICERENYLYISHTLIIIIMRARDDKHFLLNKQEKSSCFERILRCARHEIPGSGIQKVADSRISDTSARGKYNARPAQNTKVDSIQLSGKDSVHSRKSFLLYGLNNVSFFNLINYVSKVCISSKEESA